MSAKRGGLGTNLDSLIPTSLTVGDTEVAQQNEVPISSIFPNPRQPRTVFDEDALNELIASIKEIGILQPPVVRKVAEGRYDQIMNYFAKRSSKIFIEANSTHSKRLLPTLVYSQILVVLMRS